MKVTVNGIPTELDREMSIGEFLRTKGIGDGAVAVEHNLRACRREMWETIFLEENDRLEIVQLLGRG